MLSRYNFIVRQAERSYSYMEGADTWLDRQYQWTGRSSDRCWEGSDQNDVLQRKRLRRLSTRRYRRQWSSCCHVEFYLFQGP